MVGGADGPGDARLKLRQRCRNALVLSVPVVATVDEDVELGGKGRRKGTDLFEDIIFFVAFLYRTEHPFCHGLVADAEFDGSVQDGSSENGVGVPSLGPRTGRMSVHDRRGRGYAEVENSNGSGRERVMASVG